MKKLIFQSIFTEEQLRDIAPNSNMVFITRRLLKKQQNHMANYIVTHMLEVTKPIVINVVNNALSRPRSSNQTLPFQVNPVITRYVPSSFVYNNVKDIGQIGQPLIRIM